MGGAAMSVIIEKIERPGILYRVGKPHSHQGLWYDEAGRETRLIDSLSDGQARHLPMGPDPVFRANGRRWISVTDSLPALARWFSLADMIELHSRGYQVEAITVRRYRRLVFPTFAHEVYCREDAVSVATLPPYAPFASAAASVAQGGAA
jgi:hypothetical protein